MRYAAQIVFLQVSEHKWRGNLLNRAGATDMAYAERGQDGSNPLMKCVIDELPDCKTFKLMTQGETVGSRRYSCYSTLTKAQEAAIKWCGRRFKIEAENGKR